jgi:hypothetical protein
MAYSQPSDLPAMLSAPSLDDAHVGAAGQPSPHYAAYLKLRRQSGGWDSSQLRASSPAGRVYAAMIELERGQDQAFRELLRDPSALRFRSGCEVIDTQVSEVAQSFLDHAEFLGFSWPQTWKPWVSGQLIAMEVEDALYLDRTGALCLRLRIRNLSSQKVGLSQPQVRINQWTTSPQSRRLVVDERRQVLAPMAADEVQHLSQQFRQGTLIPLEPGQSRSFFLRFSGQAPGPDLKGNLVISLDGFCRAVQAQGGEQVAPPADFTRCDLTWPAPQRFRPLPAKATFS